MESSVTRQDVTLRLAKWVASLLASSFVLALAIFAFWMASSAGWVKGNQVGAVFIAIAEVAAVAIHVVAIAILLSREPPADTSLERARGG